MQILKMQSPGQVVVFDTGLNAAPLIQEVVLVALAPAVVEHLAFASVAVVEEPTHSVEKKLNMGQTWKYPPTEQYSESDCTFSIFSN